MINNFGVGHSTALLLNRVADGAAIINLSSTSRVWIGYDPSLASGTGTPLEPLSSMTKTGNGPVFAILDALATDVASVILTDEFNGYSNPIALASAVASSLLVTGIPNVLVEETAYQLTIPVGQSHDFDVSKYATIAISCNIPTPPTYQFIDVTGRLMDRDFLLANTSGAQFIPTRLAVQAPTIRITNNDGVVPLAVIIMGTNRPPLTRLDTRIDTGSVVHYVLNGAMVVGTNTLIGGIPYGSQGLCQTYFQTTSTVTSGYFSMLAGNGVDMPLCETSEMVAGVSVSGKILTRQFAIPPGILEFRYHCVGAASGAVGMYIAQGILI